MSHLLAFHLGSIQDFIATARRTQDLWMGSWLLSHLSQTAIDTVQSKGAELVLPKKLPKSDDPAVADTPNHFLARVKEGDAVDVARQAQTAVERVWCCIHCKVKSEFFSNVPFNVSEDLWKQQLKHFLEIYWAVVPDDGSKEAHNRAQAALDARKRLRDFRPTCEPHLKCTLCGTRRELSGKTTVGDARDWWIELVNTYLNRPHLEKLRIRENGNERLCAVCAVKRAVLAARALKPELDKYDGHFPSTSSVVAAIFKKRLLETGKAQTELETYLRTLKDLCIPRKLEKDCLPSLAGITAPFSIRTRLRLLTFDGDLLYTENLGFGRVGIRKANFYGFTGT